MQAAKTHTNSVSLWNRIIAAHPSITDVERRRQSRLLNIFFIAAVLLLGLFVVAEIMQVLQKLTTLESLWPYFAAITAFAITYAANKRGFYRAASYGFVFATFVIFPMDYLFNGYSAGSLLYFVAVLIASAIFLPFRQNLIVLLITVAAVILLVQIHPVVARGLSLNFLIQLPLVCGTLVLIFIQYRNGLERDRQKELAQANAALRVSETSLERRISERTRDLELAAQIATKIASLLNVKPLLSEIVELTKSSFNLYYVSLHLYDETTEDLTLEIASGELGRTLVAAKYNIHVPTALGMIPEAARRRTAVNSDDVTQTPIFIPHPLLTETRSELSLPMIVGERLIGVLDCQSEQLSRFGLDDIRAMTTLADQIAVAVENAQLFDATEKAQRRAELIAEINQQIIRATDEFGILAPFSRMECDDVSLFYTHYDDTNQLDGAELIAALDKDGRPANRQPSELANEPYYLQRSEFPFVQTLISSELSGVFIDDVDVDPGLDGLSRSLLQAVGAKTLVVLPLKSGNVWQAVIVLRWNTPHALDEEQKSLFNDLLPRMADHVAARRAFLNAQSARQNSDRLFQISRALNQVQSYDAIVDAITAQLDDPSYSVTLIAYENFDSVDAKYCDVLAQHVAPKMIPARQLRFEADSLKEWTKHEVVVTADITQVEGLSPEVIEAYRRDNVKAMALMGLGLGSRMLGGLTLTRLDAREFTNTEKNYFRAMAEMTAAAVERTRLYIEQVKTADQLRAVDQMKSQFLASMSHELRTPLNAILNFTEFVSIGMLGDVNDGQRDALNKSLDSGRHLLSLINDVLDITKMEAGMMTLFIEDNVNLYSELTAVITATETLLKDKPVVFTQDIDPDLPRLVGDRRRIRQILLNLLSNAAKFTDEGHVTLRVKTHGDQVVFSVADSGPGVAMADQTIIFEPFIQTDVGIKHAGGTGLGLPISKRLAEAHDGKLWVESEAGFGATFYVSLPTRSTNLLKMLSASEEKFQAATDKQRPL